MSEPTMESASNNSLQSGVERIAPEAAAPLDARTADAQAPGKFHPDDNRIVKLEEGVFRAEQQIRTLMNALSSHDSGIAAIQAAVTSCARSVDRLEKSLASGGSASETRSTAIDQSHRAELEGLKRALQRAQLEAASARSREVIAARQCVAAQRAYEEVVASPSWRATRPIRVLTKALSPKAGSPLRLAAKAVFWLVTPFSMPRRLRRFAAGRRAARRFAADYDLVVASQYFDAKWYLAKYPDVAAGGQDPLSHYLMHGAAENRDPGPSFDTSAYVAANADVAASGVNPLVHYLRHGFLEQRALGPAKATKHR